MNRYRVSVVVRKTYVAEESTTFEVEAENEDAANGIAINDADRRVNLSSFDADHEDTDVTITDVECIEGDNHDGRIPRCDKTIDMFQGA